MSKAIKISAPAEKESGKGAEDYIRDNELHIPAYNRKKAKPKKRYRLFIVIAVVLLLFAVLLKYAEYKVRPIIVSMATVNARSIASRIVSEAIAEELEKENVSYNALVVFEKDVNDRVSALTTDIVAVNRLKARLSVAILNKIAQIDVLSLNIPLGNIINGEFFSGRGPEIEIRVIPVGSVTTDIANVFTAAGINQTRHQLVLNVDVEVSVILPFSVETANIKTAVCVAETVIVGDVPSMYASIE